MDVLHEIWREVGSHLELGDVLPKIQEVLAPRMPLRALIVREILFTS